MTYDRIQIGQEAKGDDEHTAEATITPPFPARLQCPARGLSHSAAP